MERFDVFVIGGGATGSEIAFRLGRHGGLAVGLAERDKLGGECNLYGCVPTKVMLRSAKIAALARDADRFGVRVSAVEVDFLAVRDRARRIIEAQSGGGAKPFERLGVRVLMEEARLVGPHLIEMADGTEVEAERIVLATGSESVTPPIDGIEDGPYWTNKEAIWKPESVPRSIAILGTGAIGIEFAQIYARFGSSVTAIEALPRILPNEDEDAAADLAPALEEEGIRLVAGTSCVRAEYHGRRWRLHLSNGEVLESAELLVATGRCARFEPHDLDAAGVQLDEDGKPMLTDTLRTTNDHVWAAGDATGELLFTHVGTYEADLVVDDILGKPRLRDYRVVPRVTFCDPEVASVGLTERQAREAGNDVRIAKVRIEDGERATIEGRTHGVVKLVADARTGELLGGHVVGEEAGAMIHEVVTAMAARIPAHVLGNAIHAYPTFSEVLKA
ncbi:MAG TPA: NAD(P)/FAD-dependent oxidoreductase, partial [Actinomycetota bacterium]|nr:NAD(P)/FAD-dependent oxidoreductase [Actinomycetota bacterium]